MTRTKWLAVLLFSSIGLLIVGFLSGCDNNKNSRHNNTVEQADAPTTTPTEEAQGEPTQEPMPYKKVLSIYVVAGDSLRFVDYTLIELPQTIKVIDSDGVYIFERKNVVHYDEEMKQMGLSDL